MNSTVDVTVAGAGVFGLSSALALARAGLRVCVVDPGGANASSVAAGMLAPAFECALDPVSAPHAELMFAARDLWPEFARRAGIEIDRAGVVATGSTDWLERVGVALTNLGVRPRDLSPRGAGRLAPGLKPGQGFHVDDDWRVDAAVALAALRSACAAAGAVFRNHRIEGPSPGVLVAASGFARDLAPELSCLQPIKGHIVRCGPASRGAVVRSEGVYAVPGVGGLAFGATMEPGRSDADIDADKVNMLLQKGVALFPELAAEPARPATGVRAATPDGLPIVGWSRRPGVIVAGGARRNGWLLAPMVADVVAACVTERDGGPNARAFDPTRFDTGEAA